MKMNKAFTLAETLIVIAIIGIIAALTIPVLMGSYVRKACAVQLKRAAGEITTAAKTIIAEEKADEAQNDPNNVDLNGANVISGFYLTLAGTPNSSANTGVQYFLHNYFKHTKEGGAVINYMAAQYKNASSQEVGTVPNGYYCIQTRGETGICMMYDNNYRRTIVFIDTNGKKAPNIIGVDMFSVQINDDGELKDTDPDAICGHGNGNFIEKTAGCYQKVVDAGWVIE